MYKVNRPCKCTRMSSVYHRSCTLHFLLPLPTIPADKLLYRPFMFALVELKLSNKGGNKLFLCYYVGNERLQSDTVVSPCYLTVCSHVTLRET